MGEDKGSGHKNAFITFFSATNVSVKKILGWKHDDVEKKRTEKVVDALPSVPGKCITILQDNNGLLQTSDRKGSPQVTSAMLWPDLQSPKKLTRSQLKFMESCRLPSDIKETEMCINPYHYERFDVKMLPPILVPRRSANQQFAQKQFPKSMKGNHSPLGYNPVPNITLQEVRQVYYEELENWVTISYYELNKRVSEIFKYQSLNVIVDGSTHPSDSQRFCLGQLSNINRNSTIEKTRRHIGKGISFHYVNGEVYAKCLSDYPVFVEFRNCNQAHGLYFTTVHKIPPNGSLKIFSHQKFWSVLQEAVNRGHVHSVDNLLDLCIFRISFGKKWGTHYCPPQVVSPCWIRVDLQGPLEWLFRVDKERGFLLM